MARTNWVDVDLDGLRKTLKRRGVAWVLRELVQNALDEDVTEIAVTLHRDVKKNITTLSVIDDCPAGFAKLEESWTLFGESKKKFDPTKAGRFLAGEKFVLAMCDTALISSTTGTVQFGSHGRRRYESKREVGTCFSGTMKLTVQEHEELLTSAESILVPKGVKFIVNGTEVARRHPVTTFRAALVTEVIDAEGLGLMKKVRRDTAVELYAPGPFERAMIYELGLPVVETGDKWHVNVLQKVPLNIERDNVTPSFLSDVRAQVLNHSHQWLSKQESADKWVRDAAGHDQVTTEAVKSVMSLRFGEKAVSYDPSDAEANKLATSGGYTVVHGGALSADEWENVRRADAIQPAGKVTPSPKPFHPDGKPLEFVDHEMWLPQWVKYARYVSLISSRVLGRSVAVDFTLDRGWKFNAVYSQSDGRLIVNVGLLGRNFFDRGPTTDVNALLIHELAHEYSADHLSRDYYDALCRVGARFVDLALATPMMFRVNG